WLFILKHMHDLSDEFFCGELSFCHQLPFDRSSMTHGRQRLGEAQLVALIQESLSVAHKTGTLATRDLERVVVDTTVQPKAIAHRLTRGYAIARCKSWSISPSALECDCGRAIVGWPSAPRSWSAAIPMPTSSIGRGENSSSCAFGSVG